MQLKCNRKDVALERHYRFTSFFICFVAAVAAGIALRLPWVLNANYLVQSDEAVNAMTLIQTVQQREFYPFYLGNYNMGLTQGLLGLPFYLFWGVTPFAYKCIGYVEFILYALLIYSAFLIAWNTFSVRKRAWHYVVLFCAIAAPPPIVFKASQALQGGHLLVGIIAGYALLFLLGHRAEYGEASSCRRGCMRITVLFCINLLGVYTNTLYLLCYPALCVAAVWGACTEAGSACRKFCRTSAVLLVCFMLPIVIKASLIDYHKTHSYENAVGRNRNYTGFQLASPTHMRVKIKTLAFRLLPKFIAGQTEQTPFCIAALSAASLAALTGSLVYSVTRPWRKYCEPGKQLVSVLVTGITTIILLLIIAKYHLSYRYLEALVAIAPVVILLYLLGSDARSGKVIATAFVLYGLCSIYWLIQFYVTMGLIVPSKDPGKWFPVYPSSEQPLIDFALENDITYAHGSYWETYIVTWLSEGRLKWASTVGQRMRRLQEEVDENDDRYWIFREGEDGYPRIVGDVPDDLVLWKRILPFHPDTASPPPAYAIMVREKALSEWGAGRTAGDNPDEHALEPPR